MFMAEVLKEQKLKAPLALKTRAPRNNVCVRDVIKERKEKTQVIQSDSVCFEILTVPHRDPYFCSSKFTAQVKQTLITHQPLLG